MAEYGRQTDDPTRHTDEYGNIVNRPGAGGGTDAYGANGSTPTDDKYATTGGEYGTHGTTGTGDYGAHGGQPTHGTTGTGDYGVHGGVVTHGSDTGLAEGGGHRRSGSSSSSEDDGEGGRRKKGLKEKIKEKLPGSKSSEEETYGTGITTGVGYEQEHHEKTKGMMEKIKEKLPGHH